MWQRLYEEVGDLGFVPITVAFDSAGVAAAGPWIEAAKSTYPSLIDSGHLVAELYGMVNVPTAVWINEEGRIVRPPESAGATDGFREMDPTTFKLPEAAMASSRATKSAYVEGLKDWARRGEDSAWALSETEVLRRMQPPSGEHALAATNFAMGLHLFGEGNAAAAQPYFAEAQRLHPENWSYKRQAWALDDPAKAGGPEFWGAVKALGDKPYYPPIEMPTNQVNGARE